MKQMFKIVATDLDGTLLRSEYGVSPRTVEVVRAVQETGALVVPVTARPPKVTFPVAEQFAIRGVAVCANGALLVDLDSRKILDRRPLATDIVRRVIETMRSAAPGVLFACEDGLEYRCEPGYPTIVPVEDRIECDAMEFLEITISKLVVKHPSMPAAELREIAARAVGALASTDNSGPEWVEVHAVGVTKATMLADLAASRGFSASQVIAFGDYRTDVPMLRWAGHGVAPANAFPEALDVADEICPPNDEDGVAQVLERLLSDGMLGR